ncbi:MAG: hypothetical protein QF384_05820, partial [Alphaproteobacteria bacterium]|nr:hypothetical protein [Alphaproteobacteria bacterium]
KTFSARGTVGSRTRTGTGGGFRGGTGRTALLASTFAGWGFAGIVSGGSWRRSRPGGGVAVNIRAASRADSPTDPAPSSNLRAIA